MILPLALAQFIASYAATNMNVAIGAIAKDLGTTVSGVQTAITLFTLTMAALMIPGSKLTDIWGRKRCFMLGLAVYAVGALLAALSQGLVLLVAGYSLLEGVGSALMIPPIYILVTVAFPDVKSRARYFGVISGAGGLGAAAGPLIGGLVTSAISWRASFGLQVLVVVWIIWLARKISDPARSGPAPRFDLTGAVLSAAGLFFVVLGLLQSRTYGFAKSRQDFAIGGTVVIPKGSISPVWIYVAIGALFLLWFFLHVRASEKKGRDVLLPLRLFRDKVANLGLGTQTIQWLILQGSFFTVSVYLQEVNHYSPIQTGLILTPATIGILAASAAAGRFARRHPQRWLIIAGFLVAAIGMILLLVLVRANAGIWRWIPGLLLFGAGVGTMLTSSVNVVQSSFPEEDQGEISGARYRLGRLGPGRRQTAVGQAICRGPDHDAGHHPDRARHRGPHPPPAGRGRGNGRRGRGLSRRRARAGNAGRLSGVPAPVRQRALSLARGSAHFWVQLTSWSAHFAGGCHDSVVDVLRAHVELLGDALSCLHGRLLHGLTHLALAHDYEGGLAVVDDVAEFLDVGARHAAPQVAADPADGRAHQGGADNRRREQDADHRAGGRAAPRAVPGGHLVFVDVHLAVEGFRHHGGVVGTDRSGGVQVLHDLVVLLCLRLVGIGTDEDED
jgi:MFS family permease